MTNQPSEAALKKACEVLKRNYSREDCRFGVTINLARHIDAEDKAARDAQRQWSISAFSAFTRRHILPANPVTFESVFELWRDTGYGVNGLATMLRDAGLLREGE